ncbi:2,3-bisphosphoglycerate-dependent phosphoglycerate mutase, partial [Kribbella antibiotica]|uniref:2,3-bisphosphoglycerate-dependent phosphoglycerate mutase n=1 Tax=Kribbella antibiotica TaxID=190195 RepID=UPI001EE05803
MTYRLILLRHGHSDWNAKNLFTGWVDVDLNAQGVEEAHRGGELLRDRGLLPDVLHTSLLHRAIRTANIALEVAGRSWIDVRRSWRLNERHYGALQGKDKKQTLEELGEEQFMLFRRSYDTPPPAIERGSEFDQAGDLEGDVRGADRAVQQGGVQDVGEQAAVAEQLTAAVRLL